MDGGLGLRFLELATIEPLAQLPIPNRHIAILERRALDLEFHGTVQAETQPAPAGETQRIGFCPMRCALLVGERQFATGGLESVQYLESGRSAAW